MDRVEASESWMDGDWWMDKFEVGEMDDLAWRKVSATDFLLPSLSSALYSHHSQCHVKPCFVP